MNTFDQKYIVHNVTDILVTTCGASNEIMRFILQTEDGDVTIDAIRKKENTEDKILKFERAKK